MIISVQNVREFITTDLTDRQLEMKLTAIEHFIRRYTNNGFQLREVRSESVISADRILTPPSLVEVGDTIEITQSLYNKGIYTVTETAPSAFARLSVTGVAVHTTITFHWRILLIRYRRKTP